MRAVVTFESMYGHTRQIAQAVADGFDESEVTVLPIAELDQQVVETADVLVVGAPTHTHGLPRAATRKVAIESAHTPGNDQQVDPTATMAGVREWLDSLPGEMRVQVATFDTRFRAPAWFTGHPARRVARALRRHGAKVLVRPTSFLLDHHEQLRPGELDRALQWGRQLADRARQSATQR